LSALETKIILSLHCKILPSLPASSYHHSSLLAIKLLKVFFASQLAITINIMSDAQSTSAGSAQGTPQQRASTGLQVTDSSELSSHVGKSTNISSQLPTTSMDQLGNFPHFTNQHEFSQGRVSSQSLISNNHISLTSPPLLQHQQNTPSVLPNAAQLGNQQQQFAQGNVSSQSFFAPNDSFRQHFSLQQNAPTMLGSSQVQQMMVNSSSVPQNVNTTPTTPLVVSSQMCRQPQKAKQTPSATPMTANFGGENLSLNQASMGQSFVGNNQAQYMQAPLANVQNPMGMNNMYMAGGMQNAFGGMQPSLVGNGQPYSMGPYSMGNVQPNFMGNFQPNFMGNAQAQFNNNFMTDGAPNPVMVHDQDQTQFMTNAQGFGQPAAPNTFSPNGWMSVDAHGMQSPSMSNVQAPSQNNAQQAQAQASQSQAPSSGLSATATPFIPAQVNAGLQQRVSPQAITAPQIQMSREHQAPQMIQMVMQQQTPQMPMRRQTLWMAMQQQTPQRQQATKKGTQKRNPKRNRATQLGPDASKRRMISIDNASMSNLNSTRISSPMNILQDRMMYIHSGGTLPQHAVKMSRSDPKPQHVLGQYLAEPGQHPTTTSPTQQPTQQPAQQPLQLPASSIGQVSNRVASEEDHQNPPSTRPASGQRPAIPDEEDERMEDSEQPRLSKKELYLRQAQAEGRTIPPSQRRIVRFERDDVRLERDENGEPITPESDMYNGKHLDALVLKSTDPDYRTKVYYVAPSTEITKEVIDQYVKEFQQEKAARLAQEAAENNDAASTSTSNKAKNKTTKSKAKAKAKPSTKQGNKNDEGKLTMKPAEKITVNKRRQSTSTALTTTSASSQAVGTDTMTVPNAAHISTHPDAITHNSNAVVAQPNFNIDFTSPAPAPYLFESTSQTVPEVGDAAEPSTASDSDLTQPNSVQGERSSPSTFQSTETITASFDTLVDPALTEVPEVQQNQQMRQVSNDLSQGILQQPPTAAPEVPVEVLLLNVLRELAEQEESPSASPTTAPDPSPDNDIGLADDLTPFLIPNHPAQLNDFLPDSADASSNVDTFLTGT
jgi:hypothetical protein